MSEVYIGEFRVNINRSEIIHQQTVLTLEPKVLKVLLLLANKPGEIVSHQELLAQVWPDVVVEANTLQRCIAQLRKAFNDSAKAQNYIATHPKMGYSLVARVHWPTTIPTSKKNTAKLSKTAKVTALLSLLLITALTFYFTLQPARQPMVFTHVTPVTTTDETEYRPSFSPDGRYLAFQRHQGQQKNHLWVKDLQENREFRITKDSSIYGKVAWSTDGSRLAFTEMTLAADNRDGGECMSINTLSFTLAKNLPQSPTSLYSCTHLIYSLSWLSGHKLAFTRQHQDYAEVLTLDSSTQQSNLLYKQEGKYPYALSYSPRKHKLALLQFDSSNRINLLTLDPQSGNFQQAPLRLPKKFQFHTWIGMDWHPEGDKVLVANRSSLFEMSLDGNFHEYPIPTYQTISDPAYHPDGHRVAATLGIADFDIAQLSWGQTNNKETTSQVLYRSTVNEGTAKYHPLGKGIAFASDRSGSYQVWYDDGDNLKQLTRLKAEQKLQSFIWSDTGKLLVLNINNQLHLLDHQGVIEPLAHTFSVLNIYQWLDDSRLLLNTTSGQNQEIRLFDIGSGESQILHRGQASWAQLDSRKKLYLSNAAGQVFTLAAGEKIPLDQVIAYKKFLIAADNIAFSDSAGGIWLYHPGSNSKKLLNRPSPAAVRIDDIDLNNQRLLYLNYVRGKKEIVMFH
ncbi:winged helix-turn-helix domain-containing protein [Thalassomonas actiniarum]|uniref:Winged helix-turn-helix domain-containing protein n=1 Tax=Thalassomonas actiniarum TaxID=485447 RepID=A0AAE9YRJ6_9GAMM|nr:winged helix-turn-helix domain-containing protein [Thalassomonas actiniarum]WDD99402.1 winged helix-turn-helix domain-containing protein [Thalassomonas actiniarum]